jgi:hypothetical protein
MEGGEGLNVGTGPSQPDSCRHISAETRYIEHLNVEVYMNIDE